MQSLLFNDFLESEDTLRIYNEEELIFSSEKNGLMALLEYLNTKASSYQEVVTYDKVMGNAAALLSIKAGCREVYSPLGSEIAVKTLDEKGIKHQITELVHHILQANGVDMCPMEKLSLDKNPEEFFEAVSEIIKIN